MKYAENPTNSTMALEELIDGLTSVESGFDENVDVGGGTVEREASIRIGKIRGQTGALFVTQITEKVVTLGHAEWYIEYFNRCLVPGSHLAFDFSIPDLYESGVAGLIGDWMKEQKKILSVHLCTLSTFIRMGGYVVNMVTPFKITVHPTIESFRAELGKIAHNISPIVR